MDKVMEGVRCILYFEDSKQSLVAYYSLLNKAENRCMSEGKRNVIPKKLPWPRRSLKSLFSQHSLLAPVILASPLLGTGSAQPCFKHPALAFLVFMNALPPWARSVPSYLLFGSTLKCYSLQRAFPITLSKTVSAPPLFLTLPYLFSQCLPLPKLMWYHYFLTCHPLGKNFGWFLSLQ